MYRLLSALLLTTMCLMPAMAEEPRAEPAGETFKPARLAVVAYDPQGIVITVPGTGAANAVYYDPTTAGVGLVAGLAVEAIGTAVQASRRNRALGPEWQALDQDALAERLQELLHRHLSKGRLANKAKIKDMKFFGLSKAGYLTRYTPGTVLVYEAWMGFTPDLDQLTFAVSESIWDFRYRAKSKRELRHVPKDQVDAHRPKITVLNTHLYRHQLDLNHADVPEKLKKKARFKQFGAIWQAHHSKLLLEQIEAGFQSLDQSMAAKAKNE